ncbi:MAG: FAD-binding oxidoreductase [Candidatus Woesearchaeota archaeon]|nr:FAD-binding oxidoreductase [Candidatus Woesearchaeota archaeon]
MKNKKRISLIILILLLIGLGIWWSVQKEVEEEKGIINDVSRLNPTHITAIIKNQEVQGIQQAVEEARKNNLKVSIAGKRHSMGGHAFYKEALVLDMTAFNKTINVDPKRKIVTVQSGATWGDVIEAINPHTLAIGVMQAYNSFTVGGSLSVNVHESDPHFGPVVETVESFRLLLVNGTIVNVSRTENPELFSLVIGGYGLFGVILDVDLRLTENAIYKKQEQIIDYKEYYRVFKNLKEDENIRVIFARLSIARDETLLKEVIVTTYENTQQTDQQQLELAHAQSGKLKKWLFGLSRSYDWGKKLRWYLQKKYSDKFEPEIISRNNLMNNDIGFLDYYSATDTDVLQEYFVPVEQLAAFTDKLREIVEKNNLNLLSATIRYIPKNDETVLSYATKESYGVVLYFNIGMSEEEQEDVQRWTREITAEALAHNGTYYLPYKLYASQEQIRKAYPHLDQFFEKKQQYDPQELFMNKFYATYAKQE